MSVRCVLHAKHPPPSSDRPAVDTDARLEPSPLSYSGLSCGLGSMTWFATDPSQIAQLCLATLGLGDDVIAVTLGIHAPADVART